MDNFPHIETDRLHMVPLRRDDIERVHRHWAAPEVRKYLWDDNPMTLEQATDMIELSLSWFQEKGYGLWALLSRGTDEFTGVAGYSYFDGPELEIMYGLDADHWGHGLATEAAQAVIRFGFDEIGFDHISASADTPNLATVRVLEKAGMAFERGGDLDGAEVVYYRIERDNFEPPPAHFRVFHP